MDYVSLYDEETHEQDTFEVAVPDFVAMLIDALGYELPTSSHRSMTALQNAITSSHSLASQPLMTIPLAVFIHLQCLCPGLQYQSCSDISLARISYPVLQDTSSYVMSSPAILHSDPLPFDATDQIIQGLLQFYTNHVQQPKNMRTGLALPMHEQSLALEYPCEPSSISGATSADTWMRWQDEVRDDFALHFLKQRGLNKMADINFIEWKLSHFCFNFHWSLFLWVPERSSQ